MCGRLSLFSSSTSLSNDLGLEIENPLKPSHNIAPGDALLSVYYDFEKAVRTYGFFNWGLKTPQNIHINARIETIDTAPRFRDAWADHRCLIPSNGFYEWYKDGLMKQPYFIYTKDQSPMYFGALYYPITPSEYQVVIITTESIEPIDTIHNRMPLMIPKQHHTEWLKGHCEKEALIQAHNRIQMDAHTVSSRINNTSHNDASLIDKQDPVNEGQLRLF